MSRPNLESPGPTGAFAFLATRAPGSGPTLPGDATLPTQSIVDTEDRSRLAHSHINEVCKRALASLYARSKLIEAADAEHYLFLGMAANRRSI